MMAATSANTSATGGLSPRRPASADDLDLDVILQVVVAGLTRATPQSRAAALANRRKPRIPDVQTTWVAVGVTEEVPSIPCIDPQWLRRRFVGPAGHFPLGSARVVLRAEIHGYARLVADMLWVSQNREFMFRSGLFLRGCRPLRRVPDICGTQARRRHRSADHPYPRLRPHASPS